MSHIERPNVLWRIHKHVPQRSLTVSPHDWLLRPATNAQTSSTYTQTCPTMQFNSQSTQPVVASHNERPNILRRILKRPVTYTQTLRRKSSQRWMSTPLGSFHSPPTLVLWFWKSSEALSRTYFSSPAWWKGVLSPTLSNLEDSDGSRSPSNTPPRQVSGTDSGLPDSGEMVRPRKTGKMGNTGKKAETAKPVTVLGSLQTTARLSYRLR